MSERMDISTFPKMTRPLSLGLSSDKYTDSILTAAAIKKKPTDWEPSFDFMNLIEWDRSEDYHGEPAVKGWRTTSNVNKMARVIRRVNFIFDFKLVKGSAYHPRNTFSVNMHEYNYDSDTQSIYIDYKYRIPLDRVKKCRILLAEYGYLLLRLDFEEPRFKNFVQLIFQP